MRSGCVAAASTAVLLLGALPLITAHDDNDMNMVVGMKNTATEPILTSAYTFPSYFRHSHYAGWMYAHIALMVVGWVVVMPVSVMLSVARSRYHLPSQLLFHVFNGLGVFTSFVYNHSTPDLYKHNSHHPVGWVVTSFTVVWTCTSAFVAYGERKSQRGERLSVQNMAQYSRLQLYRDSATARSSRDSGQGTERNSLSLLGSRQGSQDSFVEKPTEPEPPMCDEPLTDSTDTELESEKHGLLSNSTADRFISQSIGRFTNPHVSKVLRVSQIIVEKVLLLLGFLAIASGFVVYGGVFREREVFSGLAHFVKGGIFFWYGILTLGRWMGAFVDLGWAWNVRPLYPMVSRWRSQAPSAEFTESFVIWLYGATNVFMEHLNGERWDPQDFEHVSITLLFFGGGLLGMMIESSWARELMNTTVELQKGRADEVERSHFYASAAAGAFSEDDLWKQPQTYKTSLNPMPALVIMLLGIIMSSHHQISMVSTMMHSQWGTLFCGFAIARAATYIILYLKPPTSYFPARPPTELVAAFCLTSGGLMFMFSARDVVLSIEANGLDAMAIFTVTMGFSALLLAWEIVVFSIKGWATRKELAAQGKPVS